MELQDLGLPGAFAVRPHVLADARGTFVKSFNAPTFARHNLRIDWAEDFYSSSRRDVLRGMHFQIPPADQAKFAFCIAGSVLDVIVDLRRGSPTYGEHRSLVLDSEEGTGVYIPTGCAHGFLSISETSTMYYKVTSVHMPECDAGLAWNGFGFPWPVLNPILSARDRGHPTLAAFASPFTYDPQMPTR